MYVLSKFEKNNSYHLLIYSEFWKENRPKRIITVHIM